MSIELDPDLFNRSRKNDPITSKEAEQTIKRTAQVHAEIIYDCLKQHGSMGKDRIKTICNFKDASTVTRRLPELQTLGLVEPTGRVVLSESGRNEREWRITTKQIVYQQQLTLFEELI